MSKLKTAIWTTDQGMLIKAAAIFQHAVSIVDVAKKPLQKASMSEILTAMSGITCAGVTLVTREGETTSSHPITTLSVESAKLRGSVVEKIFRAGGPKRNPDAEEEGIETFLKFLKRANTVIKSYPDSVLYMPYARTCGGTLRDVSAHIEDILQREEIVVANRPKSQTVAETSTYNSFPAAYIPNAQKADVVVDVECEEEMGESINGLQKANQKPPKFRASVKAHEPVFE